MQHIIDSLMMISFLSRSLLQQVALMSYDFSVLFLAFTYVFIP